MPCSEGKQEPVSASGQAATGCGQRPGAGSAAQGVLGGGPVWGPQRIRSSSRLPDASALSCWNKVASGCLAPFLPRLVG